MLRQPSGPSPHPTIAAWPMEPPKAPQSQRPPYRAPEGLPLTPPMQISMERAIAAYRFSRKVGSGQRLRMIASMSATACCFAALWQSYAFPELGLYYRQQPRHGGRCAYHPLDRQQVKPDPVFLQSPQHAVFRQLQITPPQPGQPERVHDLRRSKGSSFCNGDFRSPRRAVWHFARTPKHPSHVCGDCPCGADHAPSLHRCGYRPRRALCGHPRSRFLTIFVRATEEAT